MEAVDQLPRQTPRCISFGGCGFLGVYHFGVLKCIQERAPCLLQWLQEFYGTSAGAMAATCVACSIDFMVAYKALMKGFEASREFGRLSILHPFFDAYTRIRSFFDDHLPSNAHILTRGKLQISLSVFPSLQSRLVSNFTTRKELINVS